MSEELTPRDLLARAKVGDDAAWNEIVRRYSGLVTARIRQMGLAGTEVDDAVQSTWLRLATSLEAIRDPDRLGGWLWAAARSSAVDLIRGEHRLVACDDFDDRECIGRGVDAELLAADTAEAVRSAIDSLTDRQRELVEMRYLDESEPSYAQIAERLDMRVGAIGPTLGRAMHRMRSHSRIVQLQ